MIIGTTIPIVIMVVSITIIISLLFLSVYLLLV